MNPDAIRFQILSLRAARWQLAQSENFDHPECVQIRRDMEAFIAQMEDLLKRFHTPVEPEKALADLQRQCVSARTAR